MSANRSGNTRPLFTIERLRTLVLVGGIVLIVAIGAFLAIGNYTRRFLSKDLPKQLGINIESQADGVNYTQSRKGKTLFKIHAARAVKMKDGEKTLLHDVTIDLYGEDGKRSDTISGHEFEYDPEIGIAQARGAVEITLMRPGEKPAVANLIPGAQKQPKPADKNPTPSAITDNEIHVKTSGLIFDQKSGIATTEERVDFALRQGSGRSAGATYDSAKSLLVLDRAVELHVDGNAVGSGQSSRGPITIHSSHAEFERTGQLCRMTQAVAEFSSGTVAITDALLHFRDDGSVERLDGSSGVDLLTPAGSHLTAPRGRLDFDAANRPHHGLLEGGAHLVMSQLGRQADGSSPTAVLAFDGLGQLSHVHMQDGVRFESRQQTASAKGAHTEIHRTWTSKTADVAFSPETGNVRQSGNNPRIKQPSSDRARANPRMEPRTIHGEGGVVVTSETTSADVVTPSKLTADAIDANLAPGGVLSSLTGAGHASFEERTAKGVQQSSSSDRLDVRFAPDPQLAGGASEIDSVVQIGHVVLTQDSPAQNPATKASVQPLPSGIRATADRSDYDGRSQLLHLSGSPRIHNGSLEMTADKIDFDRSSGDAQAHGDVRATWSGGNAPGGSLLTTSANPDQSAHSSSNGPVHAIATMAEMHQATQEVTLRGDSAGKDLPRIWQSANSVTAPVIVLNRQRQTLDATSDGSGNQVYTVLLNQPSRQSQPSAHGKAQAPSLIRIRSNSLHHSEAQHLAIFKSGTAEKVTAETTESNQPAKIVAQQVDVRFFAGQHPAASGSPSPAGNPSIGNSSIDRLIAQGQVTVTWPDRHGSGEELVYLSDDGTFTLTGTSTVPPRITDQARGTVTGNALIFHTRDDSVTVEGQGAKTVTETRAKK
jgi:lipopolysaccharide export system protein LptA